MNWASAVRFIGLGGVLGFLSGLFGVGGSSVATPILRLLAVPRLVALATPLPVTLPTALVSGLTYWRKGLVNLRAALWTAVGGVPMVVAGSYLTLYVPGRGLMILTGIFVTAVGFRLLHGPLESAPRDRARLRPQDFLFVGAGVGFLSGLLANGGGFLLVPAYLLLFSFEPQEAAATSLVAVALLGLPGTWVHWTLGHIDLRLALCLSAGVIPFAWLGARVGSNLQGDRFRLLFGGFLVLFGIAFLTRTIHRVELYGWWG